MAVRTNATRGFVICTVRTPKAREPRARTNGSCETQMEPLSSPTVANRRPHR
jgi:hypothetical protein